MKKVSLISPSRKVFSEDIEISKKNLFLLDFEPTFRDSIYDEFLYYAGLPKKRSNEINEAFNDQSTNFIFSIKGGMGAVHTLEFLDKDLIKKSKKVVIGYFQSLKNS